MREVRFPGCTALESITVASGNARYSDAGDNLIDTEQNILLVGSANSEIPTDGSVTRIAAGAFVYGGSYTNGMQQDGALYVSGCLVAENDSIDGMLTVREGTWLIADLVFWREMYITEASLPNSVQYIGNYAFYECEQLASVTFGSGLVSIGEGSVPRMLLPCVRDDPCERHVYRRRCVLVLQRAVIDDVRADERLDCFGHDSGRRTHRLRSAGEVFGQLGYSGNVHRGSLWRILLF